MDEGFDSGAAEETAPMDAEGSYEGGEASESESNQEAIEEALRLDNLGELGGRMVQLKIDGEDVEIPLSEALNSVGLAKASHRRFEEAAAIRKEMEGTQAELRQFFGQLKSDPFAALEALGLDIGDKAMDYVRQRLEEDALPEDQKRLRDIERREKALQDHESKRQQAERERLVAQHAEQYQQQLLGAFNAALDEAQLPKEPGVRAVAIERMAAHLQEHGNSVPLPMLAKKVSEGLTGISRSYLQGLDPDALAEYLGADKLKALSERRIAQLRKSSPSEVGSSGGAPRRGNAQKQTYASEKDFMRALGLTD